MNTFKQIPKRMGRIYSHPSGLFQNSFISYIFFHHSLLSLSESVYNSLQALHFLISGCLFPFKYFLIFRMAFFTKVPILRMKFSSFPENRSRIYPFRQITRRAESAQYQNFSMSYNCMIIHFIKLLQEACHIRSRWEYPVKELVHQFRSLRPPIYYHFLSGPLHPS